MTIPFIRLRPVILTDSDLIWRWKNDPEAVAQSFSLLEATWEEHKVWFETCLDHSNYLFYLAETKNGLPLGYIRYYHEEDQAECSLCIDSTQRGQRLGTAVSIAGATSCFHCWDVATIVARIKVGNRASRKTFERAGYGHAQATTYRGFAIVTLTLFREEAAKIASNFYSSNTEILECL